MVCERLKTDGIFHTEADLPGLGADGRPIR